MADNPQLQTIKYPWSPDGDIRANFAIGSLRESMKMWMTLEGGIHAETLMLTIGALAGMAGQNAVWEEYVLPNKPIPQNGLVSMQTKDGQIFFAGDLINHYIVPEQGYNYALWNVLVGRAVEHGVTPDKLPDVADVFRRVASTLGSPEYEQVPVPEGHSVGLTPRQAVELFWNYIVVLFTRKNEPGPAAGQVVDPLHWPLITSIVAGQFLSMTKDVIDTRLAFSIAMNAAIIASKFDRRALKLRPAPPSN